MTSAELVYKFLVDLLNASLVTQGLTGMTVTALSKDLRFASVLYVREGRPIGKAVVQAEILLPRDTV